VDFALSLEAGVTNTTAWRLMLRCALGYRLVNHLRRHLGPVVRKLARSRSAANLCVARMMGSMPEATPLAEETRRKR
jgi:hypothetical protein